MVIALKVVRTLAYTAIFMEKYPQSTEVNAPTTKAMVA